MRVWLENTEKYWNLYERGKISFEDQQEDRVKAVWSEFGEEIDGPKARELLEVYAGFYEREWKAFDGMENLLSKIISKRGILTNGDREQQIKKLVRTNLSRFFSDKFIFTPDDCGASKPSPTFFRHVENETGYAGDEILFIGDDLHIDILPAAAAGWRTIWFNFYDLDCEAPEGRGHECVKSVESLEKIIASY